MTKRKSQFQSRREFLINAATLAGVTTLAACTTITPQGGTESAVGEAASAEEQTNVRFSVWFGQGDIEVWESIIQIFEEVHTDIKVDFEPLAWAQYWQKLQVGLAAGDPPDAIGMGVGVSFDYAGRKQIIPLNPLLERDGVSLEQ
ncbi:extracellular solute-binding protein [Chloroflexi bacterium TSY]|nr:extracellular solute-binding protein [Chloroflexi bacterium TSY]